MPKFMNFPWILGEQASGLLSRLSSNEINGASKLCSGGIPTGRGNLIEDFCDALE